MCEMKTGTSTTSPLSSDRRDPLGRQVRRAPQAQRVPLDRKVLLVLRVRRARLDPPDLRVILDRRDPKVRRGSRARKARRGSLARLALRARKGSREKMVLRALRLTRLLCRRDIRGQRRSITIFCTLLVTSMRFWMPLMGRWFDGNDEGEVRPSVCQ